MFVLQEVDSLLEKIKDSDVTVEIKSQDNNLSDVVQNVRRHYEKVAENNLKEADEWYKDKVWKIKAGNDVLPCLSLSHCFRHIISPPV